MRLQASSAVLLKADKAAPAMLTALQSPSSEAWRAPFYASPSHFSDRIHGTVARRNSDWFIHRDTYPVPPTTAPEPGTLMLLSTGLTGIAALVRRKLRRA